MMWVHLLSYSFGGAFAVNAIPHFVSGVMGRPFQTPFAKPPGEGLSSSTTNVIWGVCNLVAGYLLIARVGAFGIGHTSDIVACGIGGLVIAVVSARHFGRFHGGNLPARR